MLSITLNDFQSCSAAKETLWD